MSDIDDRLDGLRNRLAKQLNSAPDRAIVGNASGVIDDPNRPGNWLVRRYVSNGISAESSSVGAPLNPSVPRQTGLPVWLFWDKTGTRQYVGEIDSKSLLAGGSSANALNAQANSNSTPQGDFETARVVQTQVPSFDVAIKAWSPVVNNVTTFFPGISSFLAATGSDLSSLKPASGYKRYIVVFVKSDYATVEAFGSTARLTTDLPLADADVNEALALGSSNSTPIWAIAVTGDQSTIAQNNIDTSPSRDLRNAINTASQTATGDVSGPPSAVSDDFAMFNGATGKIIKDGGLSRTTDGTLSANLDTLIPSEKAVKTYTDNAISAAINGLSPKSDVALWTNVALPAVVYANGSSGVGATLTGVSTGVLTIDGVTVTAGMRLGIKDQVSQLQDGLYSVKIAGAIGVAFVLTRTTDADTSAKLIGAYAFALQGTVNADTAYICTNTATITIGTDAITFGKFLGAGINQLTGDATAGPGTGSQALTLATVNSNVGTWSRVKAVAVNAKGLITAITQGLVDLASEVTGILPLANGGTGVDLSATGGTTKILAQDASHVVSARNLVDADIPTALAGHTISGGTIDNTPVGTTTRALGYFSALREYIGGFAAIFTHANTADRTYTFPDVTDTVVTLTATQTLTNKSIAGSEINSGTVAAARLGLMTGDSGSGGASGAVTAPGSGDAAAGKFLKADATWAVPSGGTGTVTTVSVVTANGVSGSVANPTTTPAITLTLGALTPSSVAASGNVTGANLSGTNTGDQAASSGNFISNNEFAFWPDGTSTVPNPWTLTGASATVAQEATIIKTGLYSLKLTRSGTDCNVIQNIYVIAGSTFVRSRQYTIGGWVYATVASRVRLRIDDGVTVTNSSYHSGGSAWEWLFVTATLGGAISAFKAGLEVITGNTSGYLDSLGVAEGLTLPAAYYPQTNVQYPRRATLWHDEATIVAGSAFTSSHDATQNYGIYLFQSGVINDAFTHSFFLAAGSYTFSALGVIFANGGQVTWYIDGVSVISNQDWYNASSVVNTVKIATVTVATDGYHILKGIAAAKNVSAGLYQIALTKYWFKPTNDA